MKIIKKNWKLIVAALAFIFLAFRYRHTIEGNNTRVRSNIKHKHNDKHNGIKYNHIHNYDGKRGNGDSEHHMWDFSIRKDGKDSDFRHRHRFGKDKVVNTQETNEFLMDDKIKKGGNKWKNFDDYITNLEKI